MCFTGLTAPKRFEHASGRSDSAYAINLTYDRRTPTYRQQIYVYVIVRAGVIFGIYFTSCRYIGG